MAWMGEDRYVIEVYVGEERGAVKQEVRMRDIVCKVRLGSLIYSALWLDGVRV